MFCQRIMGAEIQKSTPGEPCGVLYHLLVCIMNPADECRVQSEHPEDEIEDVIYDNGRHPRLLGGLMPLRVFGDAPYNMTEEESTR